MGIINFLFGNKKSSITYEETPKDKKEELKVSSPSITTGHSASKKANSLISSVTNENREKNRIWSHLFLHNEINEGFFDNLEENLIKADLGAKISWETVTAFKELIKKKKIKKTEYAITEFKEILKKLLLPSNLVFEEGKIPVICLMGVNGAGKTTTIAKLAYYYKQIGYSIVIAAADTFRAAAIPQLENWSRKVGAQFVSKGHQADAAAVAYDAVEATLSKNKEKSVCLIDTAGRLENKTNLMEQLGKLIRIINRFSEQTNIKKILVVDATLGKNGMDQAKVFAEKIGLNGIILTKTDTQAKAGFLLTVSEELKLPILYVTYGENIEDISAFNHKEYIDALLTHL